MADEFSKTKAPVAVLEYEPSGFEQTLVQHKSKIILVAVLGVAGSLGYWGYKLYKEATNKSAAVAFVRASTPEDLRKVASEHAGKPAAGSALIYEAHLASADKPTEAAALLKEFLDKYPDHPLRSTASYRRAEYLSASGDKDGATKAFEEVASGDSAEAGFALLRLGDIHWAGGNVDKAKEYYTRLTSTAPFSGSPARQEAQQRIDKDLKAKAPDLVEYVEEKPTPPPGAPSYESDPGVSPNDDFLPPPQTKLVVAPPPANAAPGPVPSSTLNVSSLTGDDEPMEKPEGATPAETAPANADKAAGDNPSAEKPAGDKPAEKPAGEKPAAENPATPAKPAAEDKKIPEISKPKLDGEKKPAINSTTPK